MLNPCLKYAFTLAPTIPNSWDIERRLGTRYITWHNYKLDSPLLHLLSTERKIELLIQDMIETLAFSSPDEQCRLGVGRRGTFRLLVVLSRVELGGAVQEAESYSVGQSLH